MIPERLAAAGLTAEDAMYQVWSVALDGTVLGGAAATNAALALIWWARPLTWLYHLPAMPRLQNKLYRWVANNRYRLPGGTPSCAIPDTQYEIRNTNLVFTFNFSNKASLYPSIVRGLRTILSAISL